MSIADTAAPAADWQSAMFAGAPAAPAAASTQIGWAAGQPMLYVEWGMPASAPKRELHVSSQLLPELDTSNSKAKRLWQRPAFIVSMILTVLSIGAGAVMLVVGVFDSGTATVTALSGEIGSDNVYLTWAGDDVAYGLYAVSGSSGPVVDLTQLVRDQEAYVPVNARLYDDGTCFVVRALDGFEATEVSINAAKLDEQGAQRICVADL